MPAFFPGERQGIILTADELQVFGVFNENVETLFAKRVLREADEIQQIVASDILIELIGHGYLQRAGLFFKLCIQQWSIFDLAHVYLELSGKEDLVNVVRHAVIHNDIISLPPTPSRFRFFSLTRDIVFG